MMIAYNVLVFMLSDANNDEGVKVANEVRYRTESALKKMA